MQEQNLIFNISKKHRSFQLNRPLALPTTIALARSLSERPASIKLAKIKNMEEIDS